MHSTSIPGLAFASAAPLAAGYLGRVGADPSTGVYADDSPVRYNDGTKRVGSMFRDGRATGWTLGYPLAELALGPFLNPLERSNDSCTLDAAIGKRLGQVG